MDDRTETDAEIQVMHDRSAIADCGVANLRPSVHRDFLGLLPGACIPIYQIRYAEVLHQSDAVRICPVARIGMKESGVPAVFVSVGNRHFITEYFANTTLADEIECVTYADIEIHPRN